MTNASIEDLLVLGLAALATACGAGASGPDSAEESAASVYQGLTLQGVERCSKERFETTVGEACSASPRPVDASPINASPARSIDLGGMHGIRLPADGNAFAGAVSFKPPVTGEYILYLGTPNVEIRIEDANGANISPICGSHLPTVAPAAYPADCMLRGAYAVSLCAGEAYALRLGPAASRYVRLVIARRRDAGVTLNTRVCETGTLSSTLTSACNAAEPSTPITAATPGSSNKQITVGTTHGVRLSAAGTGFEGAVAFTPPYTADYLVYAGTPNLGVSLLGAPFVATSNVCGASIDEAACPLWKAAFSYRRLEGGVPLQLEFGPSTQSWVRTLVLPADPDGDSDGLADNYDQCPAQPFPGTSCGCSADECTGGAVWSTLVDEDLLSVAVDATDQIWAVGGELVQDVRVIHVSKFDASGTRTWARTLSTPNWREGGGNSVATDALGNVIVGGYYEGSSPGADPYAYVGKLDSAGNLLWQNSFSTGEDEFGGEIAVDGSGNIFSVTSVSEYLEDYSYETVLRKLAPDGATLWTRRYRGKGVAQYGQLAVDASGAAVMTGLTRTAHADHDTETTFIVKYNAAGDLAWDLVSAPVQGIAIAPGGDIVTQNASALSKFNSALAPIWTTAGFTSWLAPGLVVDGGGNIAVTGYAQDSGKVSLIVRKFNASGSFLWERAYEKNSPSLLQSKGSDVAFTANGSPVVVGQVVPLAGPGKSVVIKYLP